MIRALWTAAAAAFIGGIYFTPNPSPGQEIGEYIFATGPWQAELCAVICAICVAVLLIHYLAEERP